MRPADPREGSTASAFVTVAALIVAVLLAWLAAKALLSFADAWSTADQLAACDAACIDFNLEN